MPEFLNPKIARIFLLGIASGFPWVLIGSVLTLWLQEAGVSRAEIGYAGAIFAVYSVNFIWSPLLDRIARPLPFLHGQRKSWIVLTQLLMIMSCVFISGQDATLNITAIVLGCLVIAIASATQDIAIDAYRIDSIPEANKSQIAYASSAAIAGWHTGFNGLGAFMLIAIKLYGINWADLYLLAAAILVAFALIILLFPDAPSGQRKEIYRQSQRRHLDSLRNRGISNNTIVNVTAWLGSTVVDPLREFFKRNGASTALTLLIFVLLFKIGEAFLGRMSLVFYKEIGFSNEQIAMYSKLVSWGVTVLFALVSGWFTARFGIFRGLFIAGIAMASSNLMFSGIAYIGPEEWLFALTVIVDGFTSSWSNVAFVAFLSTLCNHNYSATQYALLASLGTLGRTLFASSSGLLVDSLDGNWIIFFALTALAVVPALLILFRLRAASSSFD